MTLHAAYDPDNIFAKILRDEMPAVKVYEDEHTLCFMDVFPQSEGHCLVIPKGVQPRNILEADAHTLCHVMASVKKVSAALDSALSPDGIVVTQFNGAPAGQTVFHLHFHIIPRYLGKVEARHSNGQMADISKLQDIAASIRAKL